MSAVDQPSSDCMLEPGACEPPGHEFDCALDDPAAPSFVTFYPSDVTDAELPTTWVSADLESVVALADAR